MNTSSSPHINRAGPAWTLVLLAPLVSVALPRRHTHLLDLRISHRGGHLGRRRVVDPCRGSAWRLGWLNMLLLAFALSIAEEFLVQQTSVAPMVVQIFPGEPFARAWGVNYVYFLWALFYETVFVVFIPIILTEFIFSSRRDDPWLPAVERVDGGDHPCAGVFSRVVLVDADRAAARVSHARLQPAAHPCDCRQPHPGGADIRRARTVAPGTDWRERAPVATQSLVVRSRLRNRRGGVVRPLPAGFRHPAGLSGRRCRRHWTWSCAAGDLPVPRYAAHPAWRDTHRVAIVLGTVISTMAVNFVGFIYATSKLDLYGKIVLDVIGTVLLVWLALSVRAKNASGASTIRIA